MLEKVLGNDAAASSDGGFALLMHELDLSSVPIFHPAPRNSSARPAGVRQDFAGERHRRRVGCFVSSYLGARDCQRYVWGVGAKGAYREVYNARLLYFAPPSPAIALLRSL